MTVFVNNHQVSIFQGATVGDAVLAYSKNSWKKVKNGQFFITDRFGFITETDGPLKENQRIFIKQHKNETR